MISPLLSAPRTVRHLSFVCSFALLLLAIFSSECYADETRVLFVGDTMLDWKMLPYLSQYGYDHPFEYVAPFVQGADLTVANLEMPIGLAGERASGKSFAFLGRPESADALRRVGVDVVTLANNHSMDYGPEAFASTLHHLERTGIAYCGGGNSLAEARQPALLQVDALRVAILGYSNIPPYIFCATNTRPGTVHGLPRYFVPDIRKASDANDIVVATFHWGVEYADSPEPYQRDFAHQSIESGATVVVGHHPHILQGIEVYKGRLIAYSLGNFVFGSLNEDARRSVMMEVVFKDDLPLRAEFFPINVHNTEVKFQPRVLRGKAGKAVIDHLNRLSERFGTHIVWRDGRGVLEIREPSSQPAPLPLVEAAALKQKAILSYRER